MRVPLSWLREFVDVDLSPEELAEKLTLLGMEVSSIERIGADWHDIVVGELLEVAPHPNSGKLSLTRVRTGVGDEELSIVCGATNIEKGQRVPVARPGSTWRTGWWRCPNGRWPGTARRLRGRFSSPISARRSRS